VDDGSASWDGGVVQAALDARCRILLTEDLAAGTRFGELEVVNPFEPSVHEPAASRRKRR
jgi:predicted nucleic acid-binding protein